MDSALAQQWKDDIRTTVRRTLGKAVMNGSQRPSPEELESILLEARSIAIGAIHDVACDYNNGSLIAVLPVELFPRIARMLDEHDRAAFASACRLLRAALISDPSLWTSISWHAAAHSEEKEQALRALEYRNVQRFTARLALAKDQPLQLEAWIPNDLDSILLGRYTDAFDQRSSSAGPVSLLVKLGYGDMLDPDNTLLSSLSRIPNLSSLTVECYEEAPFNGGLSRLLNGLRHASGSVFPGLRHLKVVNLDINVGFNANAVKLLENLHKLQIKSTGFTSSLLRNLLAHCDALQTVRLAETDWPSDDTSHLEGSWILPPGLHSVSLMRQYEDPGSRTLEGFWSAISSVDNVTVICTRQWADYPAFVFSQAWIRDVTRLEVHARLGTVWGDECEREVDPLYLRDICVRVVGAGDRVREVRYRHERLDTWPEKYVDAAEAWDSVSFGSADLDSVKDFDESGMDDDDDDDSDTYLGWNFARITAELDVSSVTTICCDLDRLPAIIDAGRAHPSVVSLELLLRSESLEIEWPADSSGTLVGLMHQLREVRLIGGKQLNLTTPLHLDAERLGSFLSSLFARCFGSSEARLERLTLSWPLRVDPNDQHSLLRFARTLE
ncbi:hypothetical protein BKA62DRAFT_720414 [Auriculariales sp. MPI-PUGE-AT-0066]|nr:hypothetical protein BKA62DRAFT_720414 [Auriculariales sp. MPI-PUGE-AT-0066]